MRAFLNMSYYWAEVYMTLEYYANNNELKMVKNEDTDVASSNLAYIHPYLSEKEWSLISERINNFGEKPCKEIMQKLMMQKLKALVISDNCVYSIEDIKPVIRTLASAFDPHSIDLFTDEFVINNVLCKMLPTNILSLAEHIVENLIDGNTEIPNQSHIYRFQLIINGILSVIFQRINKLLKQKRKHDDIAERKGVYSKVISVLPPEMFLADNIEQLLPTISEILCFQNNEQNLDLKIQEHKIQLHLEILRKLPVYLCIENEQKLLLLLMVSLHKDIIFSNCDHIRLQCENLIIGIIEQSKFTLLDICDTTFLLKMMTYFDRYENLFLQIAQTVFKNDEALSNFIPILTYMKNNLKEDRCLKMAIITLKILNRLKKNKISAEMKKICLKLKLDICQKILKLILKNGPKHCLVGPYALLVKTSVAKEENDTLFKLRSVLPEYTDYCLTNVTDVNIKESLILFNTILQNKTLLSDVTQDFMSRLWKFLNNITIVNNVLEDYSRLVMLMATVIPNEQFTNVLQDLLKHTEKSIDLGHNQEFSKRLKTWLCILTTNFNTFKTSILREQLELLVNKLVCRLQFDDYKEELFEEIIQFEVSVIQANHITLTTTLMDLIFLTTSILLTRGSHHLCHSLNSSLSLLDNLLKYRNLLIMDRLPPYLLQYRLLLKQLCLISNFKSDLQPCQVAEITNSVYKLEKLTKNLVESTKDMSRIAMFLIADILGQYELHTFHPSIRKHLNNCMYSLISLCDHHAVQYLMRDLSNASTEIFKIMYNDYKKFYRFTGKI